jgi:hypothetical protein
LADDAIDLSVSIDMAITARGATSISSDDEADSP